MRLPIVAALIASLALLAGCGNDDQDSGNGALSDDWYGINGQYLRPLIQQPGGVALLDRHLEQIEEIGVSFVRINLDWRVIQPTATGGYDWAETDVLVEALADHDLRWAVLGQGAPTPAWASEPDDLTKCGSRARPAEPGPFAALMGAVAQRYGSDGDFWASNPDVPYFPVVDYEAWNEPNHGSFWCPNPDAAAYARLYTATRDAVLEEDPEGRVIFGGLALFEESDAAVPPTRVGVEDFLEAAADELGSSPVDAVGIHVYGVDPTAVVGTVGWYRDTLEAAGLGEAPMVLNEVGWPTTGTGGPPPLEEETRADYLRTSVEAIGRAAESCGVIALAPHTWLSPQADPAAAESWYGVADPITAEPYPSAEAIKDGFEALRGGAELSEESRSLGAGC